MLFKVANIIHFTVNPFDCFNSKRLSVTHVQTLKLKEEVLCVKYRCGVLKCKNRTWGISVGSGLLAVLIFS